MITPERKEYMRLWRLAHKEEIKEKARERYHRNHEAYRETARRYYQKNRERMNADQKERYHTRYKEKAKARYEANRDAILAQRKRHYEQQKLTVLTGGPALPRFTKHRKHEQVPLSQERMKRAKEAFRQSSWMTMRKPITGIMDQLESELSYIYAIRKIRPRRVKTKDGNG